MSKGKNVKWSRYRPGVAQRVGRVIALLFHDRGTRRRWLFSSTPQPNFTPGKELVPILQEAGWAAGPVWTGRISRPHRDSIPDHPARSSVAIPTELPGPRSNECIFNFTLIIIPLYNQLAWVCRIIAEKLTIVTSSISDGSTSTLNIHSDFFFYPKNTQFHATKNLQLVHETVHR